MKRTSGYPLAIALLLTSNVLPFSAAAGVSGAIFTTTFDGSVVNGNLYESKCAVYLDGGPGPNAPAKAAGLPDGDYYFQVTDPSGSILLSTDPVSNRRFQVEGGVIVAYTGVGGAPHPTGIDQDHPELNAITIRLANTDCPSDYLNTPNNGGVYKVWATPVEDFVGDPLSVDNDCGGGCFHGFVAAKSKTDNFKAKPSTPTFCLTIKKEFPDGLGGFTPVEGWLISVTDSVGVTNPFYTDTNGQVQICGLGAGAYVVTEDMSIGFEVIGLNVNGVDLPVDTTYSFTWDPTKPAPVIVFRNQDGGILGQFNIPRNLVRPYGRVERPIVLVVSRDGLA
jgi:hypothetical protein